MIEDDRLAYALLHEAQLRLDGCEDASSREHQLEQLERPLALARSLMSGEATEGQRQAARCALDPATLQLFWIDPPRA